MVHLAAIGLDELDYQRHWLQLGRPVPFTSTPFTLGGGDVLSLGCMHLALRLPENQRHCELGLLRQLRDPSLRIVALGSPLSTFERVCRGACTLCARLKRP